MKKVAFILLCLCVVVGARGQIAKWLIPPLYDEIKIAEGIDAIQTDSAGLNAIWTLDGRRLISSRDDICPFKEGMALTVRPGTSDITMVYMHDGKGMRLEDARVARAYPYYSGGKLLVRQGEYYRFVDKRGQFLNGKYVDAYPFFNGYAVCATYLNLEKQKDFCHLLLGENGDTITFSRDGKSFDMDDLQFVSSVNDENIGVVVIKERVYLFNGLDGGLMPVFADEASSQNPKGQARLAADLEQSYLLMPDSTYLLKARCGKASSVSISFDLMRRPLSIKRNDVEYVYKVKKGPRQELESPLKKQKSGSVYGLHWEGKGEVLPPQFEEVQACLSDKAVVKLGGKVGMLKVFKDDSFVLKMNKGNDIAFRHQKFETSIRADFPTFLPADRVNVEVDPKTGCDIDKTSKESNNTESGNYVQYNCVLNIPSDLPDELTTIEYPVTVIHDGIKSSTIPFKVNAWHYKYFVVDVDDTQTTLENGTVSFVFNINAERIEGDGVYPTTVNILTDSLQYEYEKMSEFRYKCKVYSLEEGVNNIVVQILEQGCPPAAFPFEVEYHKPVARSRNKPAVKERVTIKKKEKPAEKKEAVRPHVIM